MIASKPILAPAFSFLALILAVALPLRPCLGQGTYNIITYGADPTGVNDSAAALRAAINAARIAGGGKVIVPPGTYRLQTTEPTDSTTHARVTSRSITIEGVVARASQWPFVLQSTQGAALVSYVPTASIIKLAVTATESPNAFTLANLRVDRDAAGTAPGLDFVDEVLADNVASWVYELHLSNVHFRNHGKGIATPWDANGNRVRLSMANIARCTFVGNSIGVEMLDWHEMTIHGCKVLGNSAAGFFLGEGGTLYLTATSFWNNGGFGFLALGTTPSRLARDIHISSCQFDHSELACLRIENGTDVNISGCSFTSAGTLPFWTVQSEGVNLTGCSFVSMSACTFAGNGGNGLRLTNSEAVSVAGCTFSHNANLPSPNNTSWAMQIEGGKSITAAACSFGVFQRSADGSSSSQSRGLRISCYNGTPVTNLMVTGAVFDTPPMGVTLVPVTVVACTLPPTGNVEYFDPVTKKVINHLLP